MCCHHLFVIVCTFFVLHELILADFSQLACRFLSMCCVMLPRFRENGNWSEWEECLPLALRDLSQPLSIGLDTWFSWKFNAPHPPSLNIPNYRCRFDWTLHMEMDLTTYVRFIHVDDKPCCLCYFLPSSLLSCWSWPANNIIIYEINKTL